MQGDQMLTLVAVPGAPTGMVRETRAAARRSPHHDALERTDCTSCFRICARVFQTGALDQSIKHHQGGAALAKGRSCKW